MSPQLAIIVAVVLLVVGWFAAGTHFNVRKGEATLRWLQEGLPLLGEKTTLRWLGSSAVELKIEAAKPPFRQATVLVLLEPRDVALLWGYARLRGRRDLFIFRADLRSQPRHELEALDPGSWSGRSAHTRIQAEHWTPVTAPAPLVAYARRPGDASALVAAAALDGCPLMRLSIRQDRPNLEVQWPLDALRRHSARDVLEAIRRLTQQA